MADDLGDDWWEDKNEIQHDNDGESSNKEDAIHSSGGELDQDAKDDQLEQTEQATKRNASEPPPDNDEPVAPPKKKRRRKRITDEIVPQKGGDPDKLRSAIKRNYKALSAIEEEDLELKDVHFYSCNVDKGHTIVSYLKQVLPKWRKFSLNHTHKMSPLVLIVCGNALRASNLNTATQAFKGKECRSLKLFSRHMKIEEQAKALRKNVTHLAVGTPARIKALLQQGTDIGMSDNIGSEPIPDAKFI